ncbi:DUF4974 domain-containing protein [Prevotella sp. A2931]|uniref:DUF4974 domain-containing protein n=1 Tax=Prevotella illustrans TaxID=2800387 RepID=A0ABS3M592_9BACT|nr:MULTISPECIES: DUF4974 domain-containing protein [Prevotella]MBO1363275.1 DUF4974 domain-containing protein [Prevotella illustrans]
MEKIEQLIQMMEQPEKYSEAQWSDILRDEECRAYYQLMSKTDSALEHKDVTDETIEREWRKFEHEHYGLSHGLRRRKMAAAFIGFALISGIAFAAIKGGWFSSRHDTPQRSVVQSKTPSPGPTREKADTLTRKTAPTIKIYDNATLRSILEDMARYYRIEVNFKNAKAADLRLFYQWDRNCGIETVAEQLNNFEQLHIILVNRQLVVE